MLHVASFTNCLNDMLFNFFPFLTLDILSQKKKIFFCSRVIIQMLKGYDAAMEMKILSTLSLAQLLDAASQNFLSTGSFHKNFPRAMMIKNGKIPSIKPEQFFSRLGQTSSAICVCRRQKRSSSVYF